MRKRPDELEPGDRFLRSPGNSLTEDSVERVTKTLIVAKSGDRFKRKDGYRLGEAMSMWGPREKIVWEDASIRRIEKNMEDNFLASIRQAARVAGCPTISALRNACDRAATILARRETEQKEANNE